MILLKMTSLKDCTVFEVILLSNPMGESRTRPRTKPRPQPKPMRKPLRTPKFHSYLLGLKRPETYNRPVI